MLLCATTYIAVISEKSVTGFLDPWVSISGFALCAVISCVKLQGFGDVVYNRLAVGGELSASVGVWSRDHRAERNHGKREARGERHRVCCHGGHLKSQSCIDALLAQAQVAREITCSGPVMRRDMCSPWFVLLANSLYTIELAMSRPHGFTSTALQLQAV